MRFAAEEDKRLGLRWQEPHNNWLKKSHFGIPASVLQMKAAVETDEKLCKPAIVSKGIYLYIHLFEAAGLDR